LINKKGNHWVVFCAITTDSKVYVLYKDSFGAPIESEIKKCISDHVTNVTFKNHIGHEQQDGRSCGPMSLKNLAIMLECLKNDLPNFIENFERHTFCAQDQVPEIKALFKSMMQKHLTDMLDQNLADLTGDTEFEEFKLAINKLIDDGLEYLPVMQSFDGYRQILEEELIYEINENMIIDKKSIVMSKTSEEHDFEKKYAKQMEKFTKIFRMFANSPVDDKLDDALRKISQQLGMDYEKLKKFFELKVHRHQSPNKSKIDDSLTAVSLDDITKKLFELNIDELACMKTTQITSQSTGKRAKKRLSL
jgi:hypothetical protein